MSPDVTILDQEVQDAIRAGYTHDYQARVVNRSLRYFSGDLHRRPAAEYKSKLAWALEEFTAYSDYVLKIVPKASTEIPDRVGRAIGQKGRKIFLPAEIDPRNQWKFVRSVYQVDIIREEFVRKTGFFSVNEDGTLVGSIFDLDERYEEARYISGGPKLTLPQYSAEMSDLTRLP